MTVLHLLVLAVGIVSALVISDLLGHRGIGAWPVGVLTLVLVVIGGLLYSPWISAFALGMAVGTLCVLGTRRVRQIVQERNALKAARAAREAERARQLEQGTQTPGPSGRRRGRGGHRPGA